MPHPLGAPLGPQAVSRWRCPPDSSQEQEWIGRSWPRMLFLNLPALRSYRSGHKMSPSHHPSHVSGMMMDVGWMMDGWCRNHLLRYLYNRVSNMLSLVATWCHLSTGNLTHWPNVQKNQILQVQRSPQGSLNRFVWPKQQRETTAIIPWILWLSSDMFLCDTFHDHRKNGSTF